MGRASRFVFPFFLTIAGLGLLLASVLQRDRMPLPTEPEVTQPVATTIGDMPVPTLAVPPTSMRVLPLEYKYRFGVNARITDVVSARALGLPFYSYANWLTEINPPRPDGIYFWQMIRLRNDKVLVPRDALDAAIAANPGAVWIIGNEPDVETQDNIRPEKYAELYHELYTYIKERDPSALVAIGGVSQPTPLRRAYLDIVLDTYQVKYGGPMPVDIWNVHAYILREEHDSWGIGIPPGMNDTLAIQYELEDHIDMDIFRRNIIDFRAWMAARGYADRPLLVSEYGFLMPHDYGFSREDIANFMTATFDFFLTARNETGYPPDDGKLVQWWLWFMLEESKPTFAASHLYNRYADRLTPLGQVYADYVNARTP